LASPPCRSVPTAPLDAEFVDPGPGRRCARVYRCSRLIHGSQPATDRTGAPRSVAPRARAAGCSRSTRPPTCGNGVRRRSMRRSRHVTSVCGLSSASPSPASTGRTSPTTECWPLSSRIPATRHDRPGRRTDPGTHLVDQAGYVGATPAGRTSCISSRMRRAPNRIHRMRRRSEFYMTKAPKPLFMDNRDYPSRSARETIAAQRNNTVADMSGHYRRRGLGVVTSCYYLHVSQRGSRLRRLAIHEWPQLTQTSGTPVASSRMAGRGCAVLTEFRKSSTDATGMPKRLAWSAFPELVEVSAATSSPHPFARPSTMNYDHPSLYSIRSTH
jgi:hypothetical protein